MQESEKRLRFVFHSETGFFFPPSPLVNWKTPSAGGECLIWNSSEDVLQHFYSSELYPPGPIIPAQRDAGFFALLPYINPFFKDFFSPPGSQHIAEK